MVAYSSFIENEHVSKPKDSLLQRRTVRYSDITNTVSLFEKSEPSQRPKPIPSAAEIWEKIDWKGFRPRINAIDYD